MRKVTLGGDRLGSGNKQKVELHGYERSTHDLGYLWRSTMSAGTLVPFLHEIGLPGDTFDIKMGCDVKTHPTVGPLFGSYKVQLDIFTADIRLYQGQLHNNKTKVGLNMAAVKLPQMTLKATYYDPTDDTIDVDNIQIDPSMIHSYLGIRGVGTVENADATKTRTFQACYFLAYWDTYKNYYANKQEELGAVIHADLAAIVQTVDEIHLIEPGAGTSHVLPEAPTSDNINITAGWTIEIIWTPPAPQPLIDQIILTTHPGGHFSVADLFTNIVINNIAGTITGDFDFDTWGDFTLSRWQYESPSFTVPKAPKVATFDLANIDTMRENILAATTNPAAFSVNAQNLEPYKWALDFVGDRSPYKSTQEGLAIKTYQSDLFNNWIRTEYIDGPGGINEITAVDVSGGTLSLDALNLSKKVYNMLNRVAVSGGTYQDWIIATYDHEPYMKAETPVYHGGLSKELVFQEVISNAAADTGVEQPLGTLAGRGVMASKHKGGEVSIKVNEHCVVLGLVSITPRIDYSQGNKWDVHLETMDDFHKPALDEIGFQELITEQMAWWSTKKTLDGAWVTKSAGKQPAWINYMTNVNEIKGNFAIKDNEMFMILNRRYELDRTNTDADILDLTTYIDPVKYNYIFAETAIDAQNFWVQIAVDMTVRRKMSAKIMPMV